MSKSNRAPQHKVKMQFVDPVPVDGTGGIKAVKQDVNETTSPSNMLPVPEEDNRFARFVSFCESWGVIFMLAISIAGGIAMFKIFANDLSDAEEDIKEHTSKLDRSSLERENLERRVGLVEKDVAYQKDRSSVIEQDVKDVQNLARGIEKQQAVLADRSERK